MGSTSQKRAPSTRPNRDCAAASQSDCECPPAAKADAKSNTKTNRETRRRAGSKDSRTLVERPFGAFVGGAVGWKAKSGGWRGSNNMQFAEFDPIEGRQGIQPIRRQRARVVVEVVHPGLPGVPGFMLS